MSGVEPVIFVNDSLSGRIQPAFSDSLLLTYCLCTGLYGQNENHILTLHHVDKSLFSIIVVV